MEFMEALKLFLASSFAVGAGLRGALALSGEAILANTPALAAFLAGPGGVATEALLSLLFGAVLASKVTSTKLRKAVRE